MNGIVLPLTREWIEIRRKKRGQRLDLVLPLTREWIEIEIYIQQHVCELFSLLRGSGLKYVAAANF